jgi:2-octaprenyl-6-methoxyphenol hydroxylase
MNVDYDLLIIGGGTVGASLACALGGQGLHIGVVETRPFPTTEPAGYDARSLALAYGTRRIFEGLDLWETLKPTVTPILKIHISERGSPGFARLDCREEGVEALGYVVEAYHLGAALAARLSALQNVDLLCPATLEDVTVHREAAYTTLRLPNQTVQLTARLLVAADGASSRVRQQLGIAALRWDYDQTGVIANVTPERDHHHVAYERFTETGPVALLPLSQGRCAVVYTIERAKQNAILALDDRAFLANLQTCFGERLGNLQRIGQRQCYPLLMVKSREHARHRVAVIGNAAHTLHPVAGQGFNVGIRDVAVLADVIVHAQQSGHDLGEQTVLNRYADWRRWDQRRSIIFTDGLVRLFTNPWLKPVRHLGLLAFDLFPPAKHFLARQTMGLAGYLPRLARGLPPSGRQTS